ncbi:hypothetical protein SDC9_37297 [bioreactor metagenome]|uniref:Peptidase U32 collagenase domain-containing protein n=1 Tax=bioreactor metagenome TaxID=1076179 RepID=A0A644VIV7_9ZZZZ|nr:DUF3656 domain-containing protein [Negativicutes bacterium]
MVELLAPVGSKEALIAAVEAGADAVYMSGKAFGARAYAPNFTDEELAEAIRFAHLRNVLVYVTVNTLVDDSELPDLIKYLQHLYQSEVDAILVQDMGVAKLAKEVVPHLPLHASTQMTIHNLEGVQFLAGLGFKRIVLAREVSLADIQTICENSDVEIETFMHGALCISYSGQCLMSSMIGGRSGNRGRCAQPCRLPYTLIDEHNNEVLKGTDTGEYLLSPKDLKTLELIPELIQAGVKSFKIEGRMKRPEYVAIVVETYRRAIDAYLASSNRYEVDKQDVKDLTQIFNREFTTAYLKGKQGHLMMSDRRPNNRGVRVGRVLWYDGKNRTATIKLDEPLASNDIIDFWVKVGGRVSTTVTKMWVDGDETSFAPAHAEVVVPVSSPVKANDRVFKVFDAKLMGRARAFFKTSMPLNRVSVSAEVKVSEGQPMVIRLRDSDGYTSEVTTVFVAEKALKRPLSPDVITKQLERLGNTIFKLDKIICEIEGEVMVPISEINDARRRAIEDLEEVRLARFRRPPLPRNHIRITQFLPANLSKDKVMVKPGLVVNVDTVEKVHICLQTGADVIMFGGESFDHRNITADDYKKVVDLVRSNGKTVILSTPRIIKEWQRTVFYSDLELFMILKPDAVSISNLGTLQVAKTTELKLHGDYGLNIYNSAAVKFFQEMGLESLTLSPELTLSQVERLGGHQKILTECLVHGYIELMITEYCTMGSYLGDLHTGKCNQACMRGRYWLNDRKDVNFPLVTDQYCRMHVLNSKQLSMIPHVPKFGDMGINRIRIEGKYGTPMDIGKLTKLYREILDLGHEHPIFTNESLLKKFEQDITRGHYFRGVL